jgi:predicted amidohydrolase YtcJ
MKTRFINGQFFTMIKEDDHIDSLITEHGKIIAINDLVTKVDQVFDCQQAVVLPGFVDAHLHIAGYGQQLSLLNLNKEANKNIILEKVKHKLNGSFLYVQGHMDNGLNKHDLNTVSSTVPIVLRHSDYHGATVNDAVLKLLGKENHPTGILHELEAMEAVRLVPPTTQEQLTEFIETAIKKLQSYGITGGHSDDLYYFNGYHGTIQSFNKVLKTLPFRTHLLMHYLVLDDYLKSGDPWLDQHPYLQLGAIKIFYDGTLSSQTALMHHPYRNTDHYGERIFSKEVFRTLIKKIRQHELPIAVHTIGDQALEELADWFKEFPVKNGLHDRIIHASFALEKTVEKLKELPLIFDIQPQFLSSDLPKGLAIINPKTSLIYPWKTYMDAQLILCGSSDAPVEDPNPLLGIASAYYRQSDDDGLTYGENEKLSIFEAVKLYTTYAQVPTYLSKQRGYLKVGFDADFTLLDTNIFKHPEKLKTTKVIATIIDDHCVYDQRK